jgi:hypothetical protein
MAASPPGESEETTSAVDVNRGNAGDAARATPQMTLTPAEGDAAAGELGGGAPPTPVDSTASGGETETEDGMPSRARSFPNLVRIPSGASGSLRLGRRRALRQKWADAAEAATVASVKQLRSERTVTNGLWIAMLLTISCLALREVVWALTHVRQYEAFRDWVQETCGTDRPWMHESILCQSAAGNWLARELVRAKLTQRDVDNCKPPSALERNPSRQAGCRHTPCPATGLASALTWLSRDRRSPVNKLAFLMPIKGKIKIVLESLANGTMPLSELNKRLLEFPLAARNWALPAFVFTHLRDWGIVIADSPMPPPDPCPCERFEQCMCRFPYDQVACTLRGPQTTGGMGGVEGGGEAADGEGAGGAPSWSEWLSALPKVLKPSKIADRLDTLSLAIGSPMEQFVGVMISRWDRTYREHSRKAEAAERERRGTEAQAAGGKRWWRWA